MENDKKKRDVYFIVAVVIMTTALLFIPTGFENESLTSSMLYEKGRVVSTDDSYLNNFSIVTTGTQELTVVVKSGKFKGDTLQSENTLIGQKSIDKIFSEGDKVLLILQLDETGENVIGARASEFYRQVIEAILFGCFALFLLLFAKMVGLKALLSFVFTALTFWKLLIPMYLNGYSPLLGAILVVFLTSVVIILLVGGLNKKGVVSLLGTMSGVAVTALLAVLFGRWMKIPGTVQEYSEALLYAGFVNLNLSDIFISVVFISAAGALMDISMDISAAQNEIIHRLPDLPYYELMKSGLRIATPVIGTMTTTLLFAYTGGFMFAFMAFMAKGTPFTNIVNTNFISAEILHTLVGSFGLVLVAPLTAVIGAFVYTGKNNKDK